MRKFLIAGLIALMPTVALAQHRGFHGGFHGGHGHGFGPWPWIAGGLVLGGAYAYESSCWRWVETPYGLRKVWVCNNY